MDSLNFRNFVRFGKKIMCAGLNYRKHAHEMRLALPTEPMIFMKPTSSYITQGQKIQLPKHMKSLHYEVELGVVIGKTVKNIPESEVMSCIGGYCLALDMTDRILQKKLMDNGLPLTLAKGFDTACPVGDFLSKDLITDPHNINLWLKVNGNMKQNSNTTDLIFSIPTLLSFISERITLEPGDLVLTGTPEGVGPVTSGDVIHAGISDLFSMTFLVE